jgi:Polyketide cyclase / dehydrase and lipid transport
VHSSWERQGDPAPGGIGAIRKVGLWPVLVREETVEYEQDRRHAYKLVGPASPAKDYSAEVVFTPNAAGGTDIRWTGSFTEGVRGTGPAMRAALGGAVAFFAGKLVKAAETGA